MPESPLMVAGAQIQPSAAAPLHTNEFFTGLWTQGSPFGPGAVPYLYQKFYSASRYDRLIGGVNVEVSTRLTLVRRPGSSVYNSSLFPPINRFYPFRTFGLTGEQIHVIASCDPVTGSTQGTVRDATGPSTNVVLWTKKPNAQRTGFVSVGNILFFGDGFDTKKWVTSGQSWLATNIGVITAVQIVIARPGPPPSPLQQWIIFTLAAPYSPPLNWGQKVTASGMTVHPEVNGKIFTYGTTPISGLAPNQVAFLYGNDSIAYNQVAETGNLTSTGGQTFAAGQFIVDTNNNIQEATGAQTANILNIEIDAYTVSGAAGQLVKIFLDPNTPLDISSGIGLTFAGLTTIPALNGQTLSGAIVESTIQVWFPVAGTPYPLHAYAAETGTVTTGTGVSGNTNPAWQTSPGAVTLDGTQQWVCKGPSVMNWGTNGPTTAPTVTQSPAPSVYPSWIANTWLAPLLVIEDSNGNLEQLVTSGTTGASAPAWNVAVGGLTNDGSAVWKNLGPSPWAANTAVTLGKLIVVTYSYYITTVTIEYQWNGYTNVPTPVSQQTKITATSLFKCIQAGTTGANQPGWINGLNTTTPDNGVGWQNMGSAPTWATIGATQNVATITTVVDSNYDLEQVQAFGKTGATQPSPWNAAGQGSITVDNTAEWLNAGPTSSGNSAAWIYAYSGKSSVTGHISTSSPQSNPIVVSAGNLATIQGIGLSDLQDDEIVIFRTKQGGSTLFELDTIPNPGSGQPWTYTDTTPDTALTGVSAEAPLAGDNNPPPAGFIPCCYYLNRIWGFVKNILYYSGGPDTLTGSGNEAFPPGNQFPLPSQVITCWPTSIGLIVFTNSDTWVLLGQGTYDGAGNPISPFYMVCFQQGVGLESADNLTVNGSTAYAMLTSGQVVSMDPGAGETEVGFPIGDQFDDYFNPAGTYLAWHQGKSQDTALYVANGSSFWFRMAAVAAPEQGNVWSPPGLIAAPGKVQAIASLETSPGYKQLLIGPSVPNNPILFRDRGTNADAGTNYQANAYISSVVLAQPGMTAGVQFVVIEEAMIAGATPAQVAILFDEILSSQAPPFLTLRNMSPDPPNLKPSKSVRAQRLWAAQDADTVVKCRHYQQAILWATENYPNELYTNTVYGRLPEKARK